MVNQEVGYKTKSFEGKNLIFFFLIAFGWTWFWWFLFINGAIKMPAGLGTPDLDIGSAGPIILILLLSPFGPTIAAFVVTGFTEGKAGLKALWGRFWKRWPSLKWLLVAVFTYPAIRLITALVDRSIGGTIASPTWLATPLILLPPFIASILNGGLSEEFGWRGYALPRFQAKWNAVNSSLILGIFEGLWHWPLTLMIWDSRYEQALLVLIFWQTTATFLRTWVFNNTGGSIMAAVIIHAFANTAGEIVPLYQTSVNLLYGVTAVVVVLVVLIFGPETMIRKSKLIKTPKPSGTA